MVKQVGGNHYDQGDKPQHWDLSIMYKWDAFQYQITKYVMRWKDKHPTPEKRLEDLKKARSFLDKYIENYQVFDDHKEQLSPAQQIMKDDLLRKGIGEFPPLEVNDGWIASLEMPPLPEDEISRSPTKGVYADSEFSEEGFLGDGTVLFQDRKTKVLYRCKTLQEAYAQRLDENQRAVLGG